MTTGIHIIGPEKFIPTESRDRCAFVMHPKDKIKEKASRKSGKTGVKP
jgi:hypothetical protein